MSGIAKVRHRFDGMQGEALQPILLPAPSVHEGGEDGHVLAVGLSTLPAAMPQYTLECRAGESHNMHMLCVCVCVQTAHRC